ncbi:MAG: sulfatase-like hydrolase/transferase [Akkermansia sp.]|nr:sulfatase-like hydrolase/transferase [Akkermansia sp.]
MKLRAFALCLLLAAGQLTGAAEKPNILLVLVDDMGWGDLNINVPATCADGTVRPPAINTPSLAKMAQRGVQLRRHYTAAPVCAPARASLFGGTHQGHSEVIRNNSFDAALENSHTLASVLREAGYTTALIGKWGIGGGMESGGTPTTAAAWPTLRGFDYFFGYNNHLAGHRHYAKEESNADPETGMNAIWDGDKLITPDLDTCYSTDLFTARGKKWITDHVKTEPSRPFFLALTLIAPHARLAIPSAPYPAGGGLNGGLQWLGKPGKMINTAYGKWDSYIHPEYRNNAGWKKYATARFGGGAQRAIQSAQRHATMITRIDEAMGDLLQLLQDLKIADNTFVVFTSDNGPHDEPGAVWGSHEHPAPTQNPAFFRSYGPMDGIKRDLWEGGLRVPCLVYAPGIIKKNHNSNFPSQFHDWMATFADLAGVPKPMRCDGVSLLPTLKGNDAAQKDGVVYSEYNFGGGMAQYQDYAPNKKGRARGEQQAIVFRAEDGRYLKAIRTNIKSANDDFEVYDVAADSHESTNIADQFPGIQEKLKAAVLHTRRAYDYARDPAAGRRNNGCGGFRHYDMTLVPASTPGETKPGLEMRRVSATCPWVPEFDTLPAAAQATTATVADPAAEQLPAGSITEYKGYINVPADGNHWHFYLTLSDVPGTKAYIKLHNFQLVDADFNYTPGSTVNESSAINTDEAIAAKTGKKGIPLKAGKHAITITVVQGPTAPGTFKLEWNRGPVDGHQTPLQPVPADAYSH